MWKTHTASLVVLAVGVSSLFASQGQQSKSPVNCPKYSVVSSVKTSPPKSKVPVFNKQNRSARLVPTTKTNGIIKLDSITEVSSDITTNQIWTAGNTYHIANDISVQALLVIEPGTTVTFASGTTMAVNNGGTLISCGTPDNPIIYTSDSVTPYYGDYYCAIYIEETASASTKVTYNYIEYAEVGIWVMNNRLDSPIENNYLNNNSFGILEYGTEHTDIQNNLIYASYNYAIEVHMSSYGNQADSGSHILIQNNTCDYYQDVGILVLGVENLDDAGQVNLSNNIISGSNQYGLVLANGYMIYTLANTGYYGNAANTYVAYDEINPVIETIMPYVNGTGTLPICYLNPNSAFVNASDQYIEQTRLIGKTTDINGFPDSNKADLGFHYPNWNYSNAGSSALTADFDNNYIVDFNDLSEFADYWLYDYNDGYNCWSWDLDDSGLINLADFDVIANYWLTSFDFVDFADFANYWRRDVNYRFEDRRFDLNGDNVVDFRDYVMFGNQWRQMTESSDPNIQIQINGNSDNGYVDVGVSGYSPDTRRIFLLANGKYIREIFEFRDGESITMAISGLGDGEQQLKAISVNISGRVTCSNIKNVTFSNPLTYCVLPERYEPNKPLFFAGMHNGTGNVSVNVYANGGNLVWSQTYDGNNVFGSIPADITRQYDFDYVSFTEMSMELLDSGGGASASIVTGLSPTFRTQAVKALLITPDVVMNFWDCRTRAAIKKAFKDRGIIYEELFGQYATYDNVAHYAKYGNVKYLYIAAHGGYRLQHGVVEDDWALRTSIDLYDYRVVSMKQSDFQPGQVPSWCEELGIWEDVTKSFVSIGFKNLEFVYANVCYGGRLTINGNNELVEGRPGQEGISENVSDISIALGMHEPSKSRYYQGWYNTSSVYRYWLWETEYQKWNQFEWAKLGEGEDLYWSLQYVISQQTDFGPLDPVNCYRLKGQGSFMDIELRSW